MKDRIRVVSDRKVDEDFRVVTKRITRTEVENIYKGVEIPYDIFEVLYELKRCDGFGSALLIENNKLAKLLEAEGVARRTVRGSHAGGDDEKIDAFKAKLEKYLRS